MPVKGTLWTGGELFVDRSARDLVHEHSPSHLYYPGLVICDADRVFVTDVHKDAAPEETLQALRSALLSRSEWSSALASSEVYDPHDPSQAELLELEARFERGNAEDRAALVPALTDWLERNPDAEHPGAALALLLTGGAQYNAGDFLAAEHSWRQVLERYPQHPLRHRAYYLLLDRETWPVEEHPWVRGAPYPPVTVYAPQVPDASRREKLQSSVRGDARYRWSPSGLPFVWIPPGRFTMGGSPAVHENERPPRSVTLSRGFWLAAWPVTRRIWAAHDPERWVNLEVHALAGEVPATRLNFEDVTRFIEWLSQRDGARYRLPSEAEWEYAARGGLEGMAHPWGNEPPDPTRCNFDLPRPVPVGCYDPNGYGLFDMVGNTFEWTGDRYLPEAYAVTPPVVTDPVGPTAEEAPPGLRVMRASGCGSPFAQVLARVSWRVGFDVQRRDGATSVRLCLDELPW